MYQLKHYILEVPTVGVPELFNCALCLYHSGHQLQKFIVNKQNYSILHISSLVKMATVLVFGKINDLFHSGRCSSVQYIISQTVRFVMILFNMTDYQASVLIRSHGPQTFVSSQNMIDAVLAGYQ